MPATNRLASSFRDPSGFVYLREGVLLRQVNKAYQENWRLLHESGLYEELTRDGLLIPHEDEDLNASASPNAIAVVKPQLVQFVSYPYEWSFSQLKDAALLTLEIQKRSLARGMSLKDASAFNVAFHKGSPIFIDTLSFEKHHEGKPWIAYRQFCQHFLSTLLLMVHVDPRVSRGLRSNIDGMPLTLVSKILPFRTRFNLATAMHIHGHARAVDTIHEIRPKSRNTQVSMMAQRGLIDSLEGMIKKLKWLPTGTVWGDYYGHTNYNGDSFQEKARIVEQFIDSIDPKPNTLWDLGANTGEFSRLASQKGIFTVAWDMDAAAVEKAYLQQKQSPDPNFLPLVQDLTNPSPGLGWANMERSALQDRGPADALMALALVHHLAIGNNVPLADIASYFAKLGTWLIIEFVPKEDSQVMRLLSSREDVFANYTQQDFERDFSEWFDLMQKVEIPGTVRTLYLYKRVHE